MARAEPDSSNCRVGYPLPTACRIAGGIGWVFLLGALSLAAVPDADADEAQAVEGISRRVSLQGPGGRGAMPCDVVQVLDAQGDPVAYSMDVDSVVCAEAQCEIVTVRLLFDALGDYVRYELPAGGNLTKWGHKPFSSADHEQLHRILSDPYSPLKSVKWDQITMPKGTGGPGDGVDGISGATVLSKRSVVVVGAAYTCCTLWHWSHGEVVDVIREMTVRASDKQDWTRYLQSGKDKYVVFAADQLRMQKRFDAESLAAAVYVMRHDSEKLINPVLSYLVAASSETGVDHFFCCSDDEYLLANSLKRVRFLEALRETSLELPAGYLDRFSGWLARADTYYEVHLLLTLLERPESTSGIAIDQALSLLDSSDSLVVRRSYRYLNAQKLNDEQQKRLAAFEQQHPDR